ncbi:MAG TPA: TonB-dependent receptor [Rhodothermales bacterium]|nr:TonB-dependent receptor [Rhodothermales bacterium]
MLRKWSAFVLLLLAMPVLAFAQNTGKLAGIITDAQTGDPLPGATVVLEGTTLGTAADVDGSYFIIGVPVGTYNIQASFVGYQTVTVQNVEINAGYTRDQNFELSPGLELDEIVVEYERPLIQKDALGAPRVITGEEIENLPIRGVASVASVQAGVVSNEGSSSLNIRGGRSQDVTYYVDGVKVIGNIGVTQSSIAEQEMLIGGLPAKYGDAMGGIISVSTKGGRPNFFGSLEAVTSEALDAYGYNLASATIGGPLFSDKLSFFLSGEFQRQADQDPRAIETYQLPENRLNEILNQPQVISIADAEGNVRQVPFPTVAPGTSLDEVMAQLPLGEGETLVSLNPTSAAEFLNEDDFVREAAKPNDDITLYDIGGNLTISPIQSVRLRLGGQYAERAISNYGFASSLFNVGDFTQTDQQTVRGYLNWTHYLSNSTFYQLQVDYTDYQFQFYDPDFSSNIEDVIFYGDINHPTNAVAARYLLFNQADSTYQQRYGDGTLPGSVFSQFNSPGTLITDYAKGHNEQFRMTANATTQVGVHQIEFGGEYEQLTQRRIDINSIAGIARYFDDGDVEAGEENAVSNYTDIPYNNLIPHVTYYGYNYNGTVEVDGEDIPGLNDRTNTDLAPYEPIYYAGYIQDKIEYRDLVLQIGFRVDVFDNNQRVLRDPYALSPIQRVEDVGGAPSNVGSDYAVYFSGNDVVGYRDLEGQFYNPNGQPANANEIVTRGSARLKDGFQSGTLYEEVFEDYEPQVNFQPRIGMTFPVTDQALFFAHYDVLTQRPTSNRTSLEGFLNRLEGSGTIGNPNLEPQKTTEYEVGFRQRIGATAAIQLSGFYRQIDNLIQRRAFKNVFPNNYSTFQNVDFGTVKGAEIEFDLRRTNNIAMNVNYTLSFAQGTGSDANTTAQIFWLREASPFVPTFLSPLDFDRRHTANVSFDYRLGAEEGPMIFGAHLLQNFGFNVLATFKSGQPYSARLEPFPRNQTVRQTGLRGEINGQQLPASTLVNLRVDRAFPLTGDTRLTAYLWVQNLLDSDNVINVYRFTGLPDDDGYLASPGGQADYPAGTPANFYYDTRLESPFNYGIPRQIRLGVRLNF